MSRPTNNGVRELVVDLIAKTSKVDRRQIRGSDKLRDDLGMDSLASLELLSIISDELDIDFDLDEAMQIETVEGAVAFVKRCAGKPFATDLA
jgi:acyl carrier protein